MNLEADLFTALSGCVPLTDIVEARIYPNVMPENTSLLGPTLVAKDMESPLDITHSGPTGLRFSHYQFDLYAVTKEDAASARTALNTFLTTFSGIVGGTTFSGCVHRTENSFYERETRLFRALVEWDIWHSA